MLPNKIFAIFLIFAFLMLSVYTQAPTSNRSLHDGSVFQGRKVSPRTSFWTLVAPPTTTLRSETSNNNNNNNDPCRIVGSVQLAGDASSTNSYYVYKNLYEDTKPGTVIGRLDFASGRPDLVVLSRMQNERSAIGWDRNTRNFSLLRSLNAEMANSTGQETQVVFRCMPRENTNMVYYIFYLFNVIDVNDNPPSFSQPLYRAQLSEAAPIGTVVTNDISATDADSNSQLTYWIQESPDANYFLIDSSSGQLTVGHPLDYELISSANLTVWVKDTPTWCDLHEHPCVVYSASAQVSINVIDIDDQPPVFSAPIYYGTISANATYGTLVSLNQTILATDGDMYISIPVVYSLHPTFLGREDLDDDPRPYLMINERTAEVYVVRQLPSSVDELVYTVKAAQMNNSAKSSVAMLRVAISHHVVRFLGRSRFEIDVVESAAPKSRIFYAPVVNDVSAPLTFSIFGRDPVDTGLLTIDNTGIVTFNRALTFSRSKSKIPFVITVADQYQQSSATAELVINVQPTFGTLPRFAQDQFQFNVSSRDAGTFVGKVELATWDSLDTNRVNFTYALNSNEGNFRIDQEGAIRIDKYLGFDKQSVEFVVTALDARHMGDSAIIVVYLPVKAGAAVEQRGVQDMSAFLVYILAAIAAILMAVVLALGVYLLKSEKQIREMQRRILGTTIDSDSHVKWLHPGGPSTSSGELGPVDPAILRTNEAYQRFLEGGSSGAEEVQSSGAESLDYGGGGGHRNSGHHEKMSILPTGGGGGMSSGYSSTASPPAEPLGSVAVTMNSGLPNHHPFAPQTQQQLGHQQTKQGSTNSNNSSNRSGDPNNMVTLAANGLLSHTNGTDSPLTALQIANNKRRYKKKYENPLNADYGLEPFEPDDSTGMQQYSSAVGIDGERSLRGSKGSSNKPPSLPPKPESLQQQRGLEQQQPPTRKSKFFDTVFGRFLPTASSLEQHGQSQQQNERDERALPAPPPPPPPLPIQTTPSAVVTTVSATAGSASSTPRGQYSVIVEHVAAQVTGTNNNANTNTNGRRHHGYINDAIFVPPPALPLPSVAGSVNASSVNRYLLDGRTIAY